MSGRANRADTSDFLKSRRVLRPCKTASAQSRVAGASNPFVAVSSIWGRPFLNAKRGLKASTGLWALPRGILSLSALAGCAAGVRHHPSCGAVGMVGLGGSRAFGFDPGDQRRESCEAFFLGIEPCSSFVYFQPVAGPDDHDFGRQSCQVDVRPRDGQPSLAVHLETFGKAEEICFQAGFVLVGRQGMFALFGEILEAFFGVEPQHTARPWDAIPGISVPGRIPLIAIFGWNSHAQLGIDGVK